MYRIPSLSLLFLLSWGTQVVSAHEHHAPAENADPSIPQEPIDSIMWMHMILQLVVWGFVFPIGMVLGMSKSRFHVPVQSVGLVLTSIGIFMGHHHGGREFQYTAHGVIAKIITFQLIAQTALGIYLKLHIHEKSVRPYFVRAHGWLGKTFPVVGWTQMLMGVVTALGYCMGGETGQCLAHYIMGSAFIGYATIMIIMLHLGSQWLKKRGQSQEWLDSCVIMIWGIINTFSMHHDAWNKNWSHKDMQHTMLGVLWWAGGALGMFLSKKGQRSFVPAVIIIMTGWGMSAHEQQLMISTKIHGLFGYSLMSAGVVRIIEICFVLNDAPSDSNNIKIFQYLPPYLLTLGGVMFMGGTDEEMHRTDNAGIDHVTYALAVFSLSFIIFLHMTFLVHLYSNSGENASKNKSNVLDIQEAGYESIRLDDRSRDSFEDTVQDTGSSLSAQRDEEDRPKEWQNRARP